MKNLRDILYTVAVDEIIGLTDITISTIAFDSRKVTSNSLFVAVAGTRSDGHEYIPQAIQQGAIALICEKIPEFIDEKITYIRVKNSSIALGILASNFYDKPSEQLKLVGVTGTNGKTTIATLLHHLFRSLGFSAGLLSTIQNMIEDEIIPSTHTTPDALMLNQLLEEMVERGCTYCFMEVSSHAIDQNRIAGLRFEGGIFTNITHDHLDYHHTFSEYLSAKKKFFDGLSRQAFALTNTDDKNGRIMIQNTRAGVRTYALKTAADFKGRIISSQLEGLEMEINGIPAIFKLVGEFNAYNLTAVYATAIMLGQDKEEVLRELTSLNPVEGRFETIRNEADITGIVDYAHTPDALKNVLETINNIRTHNEKLITVVGAGGDRDRTKRPVMAKICGNLSDHVILTSDNPRSEDPEDIIREMRAGVSIEDRPKVIEIVNRKEAIRAACSFANTGDIILIAGKGHEKYQEIKGKKYAFDDTKVLSEALKGRKKEK